MLTLRFKTSMKCSGCVQSIKSELDNNLSIISWDVDLLSADRVLTVEAEADVTEIVVNALENAGFQVEKL